MHQADLTDYQHHRRYESTSVPVFTPNGGHGDGRSDPKQPRFQNEIQGGRFEDPQSYDPPHQKGMKNSARGEPQQRYQKNNVLARPAGSHTAKRSQIDKNLQYQQSEPLRQKKQYNNDGKLGGAPENHTGSSQSIEKANEQRYILEVENYLQIDSSSNQLQKFQIDSEKSFNKHYQNPEGSRSKLPQFQSQMPSSKNDLKLQIQPLSYPNEVHSRSNRNLQYRKNMNIEEDSHKDIFPTNGQNRSHRNLGRRREVSASSKNGKPPLPTSHSSSRERFNLGANQPLTELVLMKPNQSVPAKISAAPSSGQADRRILPQNLEYDYNSQQYQHESDYDNKHKYTPTNYSSKQSHQQKSNLINYTPLASPQKYKQPERHQSTGQHRNQRSGENDQNKFTFNAGTTKGSYQVQVSQNEAAQHQSTNNAKHHKKYVSHANPMKIEEPQSHSDLQQQPSPAQLVKGGANPHQRRNQAILTSHSQRNIQNKRSNNDLASLWSDPQRPPHQLSSNYAISARDLAAGHHGQLFSPQSNIRSQFQVQHQEMWSQQQNKKPNQKQQQQISKKNQRIHSYDEHENAGFQGQKGQLRHSNADQQQDDQRYNQRLNTQRQPCNSPADEMQYTIQKQMSAQNQLPNFHYASVQNTSTPNQNESKKSEQTYKDDPIQTAQRIMRKHRLSWQQKQKSSNERKNSQKNNLFIQKHMSEQLECHNNSGFTNEHKNKKYNNSFQDDFVFSSHRSKDSISQASSSHQIKDQSTNAETPYAGTNGGKPTSENANIDQTTGQVANLASKQDAQTTNADFGYKNQRRLNGHQINLHKRNSNRLRISHDSNNNTPDETYQPNEENQKNWPDNSRESNTPGYDFSFQNFNPSNVHVANELSSLTNREIFTNLQPQIVQSAPSPKEQLLDKISKENSSLKKDKTPRQNKAGINMNIEKYSERRQAKIAKLQMDAMKQKNYQFQGNAEVGPQNVKQIQNDQKLSYNNYQVKAQKQNTPYVQPHNGGAEKPIATQRSSQHHYSKQDHDGQQQFNVKYNNFEISDERGKYQGRNPKMLMPSQSLRSEIRKNDLGQKDEMHKSSGKDQSNGSHNNSHEFSEFDPNIFKNAPSLQTLQQSFEMSLMHDQKKFTNGQSMDQKQISNSQKNSRSSSKYGGSERYDSQRRDQNPLLINSGPKAYYPLSYQASLDPPEYIDRFNIVTKFAFATSCGFQPNNPNKRNQDSYILKPNMMDQLGLHFFSVCDGHGVDGHEVSKYVRDNLPKRLQTLFSRSSTLYETEQAGIQKFYSKVPNYLRKCVNQIQSELANPNIFKFESQISGTTFCSVLFDRDTVFCANLGDSRACLFSYYKPTKKDEETKSLGKLGVTPLSNDHKPDLPKEKERILSMGGRVDPIKGPQGQGLGPNRVWLRNQEYPGLAMSRSLGDLVAHSVGVSADPEIIKYELKAEHKFIVIASDGVTEFLSDEEIGKLVWPYYNKNSPESAGNAIVREAAARWRQNDTMIDDITCITIFLELDPHEKKVPGQPQSARILSAHKSTESMGNSKNKNIYQNDQPQSARLASATKNSQNIIPTTNQHPIFQTGISQPHQRGRTSGQTYRDIHSPINLNQGTPVFSPQPTTSKNNYILTKATNKNMNTVHSRDRNQLPRK